MLHCQKSGVVFQYSLMICKVKAKLCSLTPECFILFLLVLFLKVANVPLQTLLLRKHSEFCEHRKNLYGFNLMRNINRSL